MHEHSTAENFADAPFLFDGECVGCDVYLKLDEIGLCEECGAKLERDMIRERDWDRSAAAWVCPQDRREELRTQVIRKYGAKLELIAPSTPKKKKSRKNNRPKKAKR